MDSNHYCLSAKHPMMTMMKKVMWILSHFNSICPNFGQFGLLCFIAFIQLAISRLQHSNNINFTTSYLIISHVGIFNTMDSLKLQPLPLNSGSSNTQNVRCINSILGQEWIFVSVVIKQHISPANTCNYGFNLVLLTGHFNFSFS